VASVIEAILQGLQYIKQVEADVINTLIDGVNNLPGVNIDKIIVGQSEALNTITKFKNDANVEFASIADEIRTLADTPLPSEQFDIWLEKAKQKSEEAAKAAIEARNQIQPPTESENSENKQEENPELVKMREETQKMLEELQNRYKDEDILLTEKYEKDLETLLAAQEQKLISEEEFNALMLETNQKYEDDLTKIEEGAAKAREDIAKAEMQAKLNAAKSAFGGIAQLMNSESRKAFEIGKVAAIAETTVSGISSAMGAWENAMNTGLPLPAAWALGAAGVAASLAMMTQNISKINSTSFGGGGGSAASAPAASPSVAQTQQQPERQVANISLQGSMFSRDSVIGLMEEMNGLLADGVRLNVT
jgi:hypothetical protein